MRNYLKSAVIYNEATVCTQSGKRKKDLYILRFDSSEKIYRDPLIGWVKSTIPDESVKINFNSLDDAKKFAEKNCANYTIRLSSMKKFKIKKYDDNFIM